MTGYLRPLLGALSRDDRDYYRSLYCGFCKEQKRDGENVARLLLNHDALFFYLLFTSILAGYGYSTSERSAERTCALSPFKKRNNIVEGRLLHWFAEVQRTFTAMKLMDIVQDERGPFAPVLSLIAGNMLRKRELVHTLPAASGSRNIAEEIASLGELAVALMPVDYLETKHRSAVAALIYSVVRVIFLIDALDDYERDMRKKAQNVIRSEWNGEIADSGSRAGFILDGKVRKAVIDEGNAILCRSLDQLKSLPLGYRPDLVTHYFAVSLPWFLERAGLKKDRITKEIEKNNKIHSISWKRGGRSVCGNW